MAKELGDSIMMMQFDGDLIAVEVKYYMGCYNNFRNRYRRFNNSRISKAIKEERMHDERAFLELIESIKVDAANGVTMAELTKLVNERRQNFNLPNITHPTSLKERILTVFKGDLTEQVTG